MDIASALKDAAARRLFDYWQARRGGRRRPARDDIDPLDFPYALGQVSLIECIGDPPRFRYRLVSTGLTKQLGYEMTGRFTEEIPEPETRAYTERLYRAVHAAGEPHHEAGELKLDGRTWSYELLVLPLSQADGPVDMLLAYRTATAKPRRRLA